MVQQNMSCWKIGTNAFVFNRKKTEDKIEIEDTQQHFHNFFEDWLLS